MHTSTHTHTLVLHHTWPTSARCAHETKSAQEAEREHNKASYGRTITVFMSASADVCFGFQVHGVCVLSKNV